MERIQAELWKLLCGGDAAKVLRAYPEVFGVFWPELLQMVGLDQRNPHHCYDVWEHTLHAVSAVQPEAILRCAVLLHDVGKPSCFTVDEDGIGHFYGHGAVSRDLTDQMLRRLKCSTQFRETVTRLVDWHDRNIPRTEKSIRRALRILGEEDLRRLIAVKRADNLAQAPAYWDRQRELDRAEELLDASHPDFNPQVDPKCSWALRHLDFFPVEVNRADYEALLRIPGVGVVSAKRILVSRRARKLRIEDLPKLGVVMKRAQYFLTASGRMADGLRFTPDSLLRNLIAAERPSLPQPELEQMSLFAPV